MPSGIESHSRREDAEGDMNAFSHHGPDDEHRGFSRDRQASAEWRAPVGSVERHHGRHVKRFAQECVTDFGHPRLALDARARRLLARVESGKGDGLTGIAEAPRSGIEGQQNGEGALPEAGTLSSKRCLSRKAGSLSR